MNRSDHDEPLVASESGSRPGSCQEAGTRLAARCRTGRSDAASVASLDRANQRSTASSEACRVVRELPQSLRPAASSGTRSRRSCTSRAIRSESSVSGVGRERQRHAAKGGRDTPPRAPRSQPGSWTEIRLGARAHTDHRPDRPHAPPNDPAVQPSNPEPLLTANGCIDKESSWRGFATRGRMKSG